MGDEQEPQETLGTKMQMPRALLKIQAFRKGGGTAAAKGKKLSEKTADHDYNYNSFWRRSIMIRDEKRSKAAAELTQKITRKAKRSHQANKGAENKVKVQNKEKDEKAKVKETRAKQLMAAAEKEMKKAKSGMKKMKAVKVAQKME